MKLLRIGLVAAMIAASGVGLFLLPVDDAVAATRCRERVVNGRVVKRVCTSVPRYRTVCHTYWRYGTKYQSCRRVRVY